MLDVGDFADKLRRFYNCFEVIALNVDSSGDVRLEGQELTYRQYFGCGGEFRSTGAYSYVK